MDGAAADGVGYRKQFSGDSHRVLNGMGHNVQQEDPQTFAQPIVDVANY